MVNLFTQRGLIPGISNTTNTPPIAAPTNPVARTEVLQSTGLSDRDLLSIVSAVEGTTSREDLNREFDKEFGTGEVDEEAPPSEEEGNIVVNETRRDFRLRLSALENQEEKVYGTFDPQNNILSPLYATRGLLFPYTPTITVSGESNWTKHDLIHTNFDILSYQRTPSANIQVSGKFTVQNQREGEYAIAAIHFLRTVTKMYYGDGDSAQSNPQQSANNSGLAGLPPPVLRLNGYGNLMFRDIKVVCQGYNFSFEEGADLISIITPDDEQVLLPPVFTLQITLGMQQSPQNIRKQFSLNEFRTGELMRKSSNDGWF